MTKFEIEVNDELADLITQNANKQRVSVNDLIQEILNRFVISPHILDSEALKRGYEESGFVNVEWANL